MPRPGMLWRHVVINTRGSWLPGDPRGFRNRKHRLHSSGDYHSPPPTGEHGRLHEWMRSRSTAVVVIPQPLRETIGQTLVQELTENGHRLLAIAVGSIHTHALVELPDDIRSIRRIVGDAKRVSSRAVKKHMPGRIWADGGTFKPVRDFAHHRRVFRYIREHEAEGAWVWTFRDFQE